MGSATGSGWPWPWRGGVIDAQEAVGQGPHGVGEGRGFRGSVAVGEIECGPRVRCCEGSMNVWRPHAEIRPSLSSRRAGAPASSSINATSHARDPAEIVAGRPAAAGRPAPPRTHFERRAHAPAHPRPVRVQPPRDHRGGRVAEQHLPAFHAPHRVRSGTADPPQFQPHVLIEQQLRALPLSSRFHPARYGSDDPRW